MNARPTCPTTKFLASDCSARTPSRVLFRTVKQPRPLTHHLSLGQHRPKAEVRIVGTVCPFTQPKLRTIVISMWTSFLTQAPSIPHNGREVCGARGPSATRGGSLSISHQILMKLSPVFDEMMTLIYLTSAYLVVVFNDAQIFLYRCIEKLRDCSKSSSCKELQQKRIIKTTFFAYEFELSLNIRFLSYVKYLSFIENDDDEICRCQIESSSHRKK